MTRLLTITVSSASEGRGGSNHCHPMVVDPIRYPESSCVGHDEICQQQREVLVSVQEKHYMAHSAPLPGACSQLGFDNMMTASPCRQRSVAFSEQVNVKEIPRWTVAETSKVWWTVREIKQIRREYKEIVQRIMNGERFRPNDDNVCSRGLEIRTKCGAEQRHKVKERARRAIVKAQAFQRAEGFDDPHYIAELYREYSRSCADAAHLRGISDESAVQS